MELKEKSVKEFTELIAPPAPAPGGGGACAAVAAIGIALGDMVGELTVGKKKYAEVEGEVRILMERAQLLRKRLLELIDEDAVNFEPLAKAYSIPKDQEGRDEELERCLRLACSAPLEIFDMSCEAITVLDEFSKKGSKLVLSDAATGVAFCKAAMLGALVNVKVNTRLMKDREYAERLNRAVDEAMRKYMAVADAAFYRVLSGLE
jgi:formiminotetrahydrofolate cyclodeaminase